MSVAAGTFLLFMCFWRCCCCTFRANPEPRMPAGSAKKEMPQMAQKEAMIFPFQVTGTLSP